MVRNNEPCKCCGISKENLKAEIIQEILPLLINSCKRNGSGRDSHCQNSFFEGTSDPIDIGIVFSNNESANYAASAGILEQKLRNLQLQIDQNFADITQAKGIYEKEVGDLMQMASYLDSATNTLQKEMVDVQTDVESGEMYSRRNTFEIDGYPEDPNEDTNKIALDLLADLGFKNVNFKDICRSHRTSRRRKKKHLPRPIYVKLVNHDLKEEVLKHKDRLRKIPSYRHVYIDENLTKHRRWLYSRVRYEVGNDSCYTYDGTIYVKFYKDRSVSNEYEIKRINNTKDFINVFNKKPSGK